MKTAFSRLLVLILCLCLLIPSMAACGEQEPDGQPYPEQGDTDGNTDDPGQPDTPDVPGTPDESGEPDTPVQDDRKYLDNLADSYDFSGDEIIILGYNPNYFTIEDVDNINDGDIVENSVYTRQTEVQDRFNVKLSTDMVEIGGQGALTTKLQGDVSSSSGTYSLVQGDLKWHANLAVQNLMMNLNKLDAIDFTQNYWNDSFSEAFQYKKAQFWAVGDIDVWLLRGGVAMFVNDEMLAELFPDFNLYQTVIDGEWTLEKLNEMTNNVYADTNGNAEKDNGDTFGLYYGSGWDTSSIGVAAGYTMGYMENSKYVLAFDTAENQKIVSELLSLLHNNGTKDVPEERLDYFKNGLALFESTHLSNMEEFRELKFDYSVIPLPKYNAESDYRTYCLELICIDGVSASVTTDRMQEVGVITEALAAAGRKYLTEGYYEVALRSKYARNSESYKTLEIIRQSMWIDFGIAWCGALGQIDTFLAKITGELSSAAAAEQPGYEKYLTNLYQNLKKAADAAK